MPQLHTIIISKPHFEMQPGTLLEIAEHPSHLERQTSLMFQKERVLIQSEKSSPSPALDSLASFGSLFLLPRRITSTLNQAR